MPLTQEEYTEFMKTVYQIRELYDGIEKEIKSFGEKGQESEQKRLAMEVTLQRLEGEMQKPSTKSVQNNDFEDDILETKGVDEAALNRRMRIIKKRDDVKALSNYLRKGFAGCTPEERKHLYQASAFDAPPNKEFETKASITTGITVSEDTTGGMFAPPEFVAEIIKNLVLYSVIRPYAKVRSTSNRSVQMPKRTSTLTTATW